MKIGNIDIKNVKLGNLQIKKVFLGINLIWTAIIAIIEAFKTRVLTDFGQFEAESCLETQLTELSNQNLLDSASLVITPNAYKETKLYSVIPSDASGDMDVIRATRATRVNSDGLIEVVPYNIFNSTEAFGTWTKTASLTTINNTVTAPNGTLTAETLRIGVDTSPIRYRVYLFLPLPINTYTASYYLKKANHRWIQLNYVNSTFGSVWANFDLEDGVIGNTGTGAIATITDVGNGWYRCTLQASSTTSISSTACEIIVINNTNGGAYPSYQSTVEEDVCYLWGAQLVFGTEPKEYLPVSTGFNIPRLDYSNGSCPSILVEPQRTNLILQSENFLATNWTIINSNVTATVELSPSGLENTNKLTADGTSGFHYIFHSSISFTIDTTYTYTVFAKKDTNDFIQLWVNGAIGGMFANFDLNNGVTGTLGTLTGNLPTSKITNVGNGWYRCEMVFVSTTTNSSNFSIFIVNSANATRTQSNTLTTSVFLWGAQLEVGRFATSYIPTVASTVTRNADFISKSNIYTNNFITSSGGSLVLKIKNNIPYIRSNARGLALNTGTNVVTGNGILVTNNSGNLARQAVRIYVSNSIIRIINIVEEEAIVAIVWDGTILNIYINGTKRTTDDAFPIVAMQNLIMETPSITFYDSLLLFPTPLSDAQAIQLTTL